MLTQLNVKVLFKTLVVVTLVLGPVSMVMGNPEPPGEGELVIGPPIDAVFTGTNTGAGTANVTVAGACKKISVSFGPFDIGLPVGGFGAVDVDHILGLRFRGVAPAGCFSDAGGEDVVVTGVTKFNNDGNVIGADIQLSQVRPK